MTVLRVEGGRIRKCSWWRGEDQTRIGQTTRVQPEVYEGKRIHSHWWIARVHASRVRCCCCYASVSLRVGVAQVHGLKRLSMPVRASLAAVSSPRWRLARSTEQHYEGCEDDCHIACISAVFPLGRCFMSQRSYDGNRQRHHWAFTRASEISRGGGGKSHLSA